MLRWVMIISTVADDGKSKADHDTQTRMKSFDGFCLWMCVCLKHPYVSMTVRYNFDGQKGY